MPKININGRSVTFAKMPSEADIDEAATALGIAAPGTKAAAPAVDDTALVGEEAPRTMMSPITEAGAAVRGAGQALAGGKVDIPLYGEVPAVTADETLGQSVMRAPARLGAALVRALPAADLPGNLVEEGLSEAGHPYVGKAAGFATNMLGPMAIAKKVGVGAKAAMGLAKAEKGVETAEAAGKLAQEAIKREHKAATKFFGSMYGEAEKMATKQGVILKAGAADLQHVQADATELIENLGPTLGGRAKVILERVRRLGVEDIPASVEMDALTGAKNIAAHAIQRDVSYEELSKLKSLLGDISLSPQEFGISSNRPLKSVYVLRKKLAKAMKGIEPTDVRSVTDAADAGWRDQVVKLRLLERKAGGVSVAKTGTEALRALKDPERMRRALATMKPDEQEAFKVLTRAAGIEKTGKGLVSAKGIGGAALSFGAGGAVQTHGNVEKSAEGALAGATAASLGGLVLRNPRAARTVARLLKTPGRTAAAAVLLTELAGYLTEDDSEESE